jgi:hypothetical protein
MAELYSKNESKNPKLYSSSSEITDSASATKGCSRAEDERHRHRPVATCIPPAGSRAQFPPL